jgi:hypothetical protein
MQGNFKDWSARVQRNAAGAAADAGGSQGISLFCVNRLPLARTRWFAWHRVEAECGSHYVRVFGNELLVQRWLAAFHLVFLTPYAVEGGHRAVMFSRLSGIQVLLAASRQLNYVGPRHWGRHTFDGAVAASPGNLLHPS